MDEAKRKRSAAKSWLTRVSKQLEKVLNKQSISEVELSDCIDEFENRVRNLDEAQLEVEAVIDISKLELDVEEAATFREEKRMVLVSAKERLHQIRVNLGDISDNKSNHSQDSAGSASFTNTKLPRLELPRFDGDYTQWPTFWEKFVAAVDSTNVPAVNKFTYLQSVLQGEASKSIRGLSLTADNYDSAKDILLKRFGKPDRIIFEHIQKLLQMNNQPIGNSISELWKLYDNIQINVRSLQNLGVGGDTYGVILTPLILHQLPAHIRLEWARVGEDHEGDLAFLLEFLYDEIRRRERSQTFGSGLSSSGSTKASVQTSRGSMERKGTATALMTPAHKKTSGPSCAFCQGRHYADQCSVIQDLDFENRKTKIKELGLCFRCLDKHLAKDCSKLCYFCKGNHHTVLCKSRIKPNENVSEPVRHTVEHDGNSTHVGVSFVNAESMTTLMQVVRTKIKGKEVTIMFDSGSDRSFVTTKCAKDLELNSVGTEYLSYCCFAENGLKEGVKNVFELNTCEERIRLLEMDRICSNMFRSPVPKEVLSNFKGIDFSEDYNLGKSVRIDILIGLDWYWPLIKSQRGTFGDGVVAQETVFGWMLSGVYSQRKKQRELRQEHSRARILFCRSDLKDDTVRRLWELDSIGITDDGSKAQDIENDRLLKSFNKDMIQFDGTRYTVRLPWKDDKVKTALINNREQAQKRLMSLKKKLDKDKTLEERYNEALKNMKEGDIVEEVPTEEIGTDGPVFYLPHRPVIREDSTTTKIRPVFDASCRGENGISLNDCMEIGPNLIPDLLEILVRFRRWKFGLTADITKAFLQINVHDTDKDCHRFLWNIDNQIRVMRFNRVIFGNASSPFLLNATVRFHLAKFELTRTVKELRENLYVDDWLTGADSEQEVQRMVRDAEEMMKLGGFPLAKWASNSQQTKNELSKTFEGFKDVDVTKVLGLTWMTEDDNFRFHTIPVGKDSLFTKRLILSIAARLFDPMGFLTPFTINLKILFQEAWKIGYKWDDILPVEFQEHMKRWINGLEEVQEWRVPRCIIPTTWTTSGKRELLVFADASEKAYGCCLYLRTTEGEQSKVSLVMSKVKVASIKKVTLPRLELLAALLAARLLKFVSSALQVGTDISYTCWTDSQIVLNWIKGDAFKWKQFVSNRVQEIQQLTDPARWKHCPGKENPADLLTRGIQARELINSALWLQGPKWLRQTERESVSETLELEEPESVLEGLERERRIHTILTTAAVKDKITPLMNYERYSDFGKIVRILAWIERFIKNCKHKAEKIYSKDLTAEELESGRISLLRSVQIEYYGDEIKDLQNNKNVKKSSSIQRLSPFIGSHGLMRVYGRLDFASSLLYDERHPIILPKCHISQLIVKAQHSLMKHAGVNTMISTLRNTYWIISIRTLAKKICRRCINCQRQDSRPGEQITAPLPEDRVKQSPPFSVIGVDHAGPLFCSDMPDTKRYILLFTCAIVRAIHIELVDSLSVDDFILAFKRFSARRGRPSIVYSDNAKTFKAACQLLMKEMGHVNLTWKFSAPLSPWWGGWWERLIRSVKSSLRKSLGQRLITRVQLETLLQEIEACVNSRPLTYVEETGIPLSPSHFLIGRNSPLSSTGVEEFCEEIIDLRLREKCQSMVMEKFWEVWRDCYLKNLPPLKVHRSNEEIKTGTVVLVRDDGRPRLKWPLGVVTKTFPGKDGLIRAVELKTNKGLIVRAVQKLHKLEMFDNKEWEPISVQSSETETDSSMSPAIGSKDNVESGYTTRRGRQVKRKTKLNL